MKNEINILLDLHHRNVIELFEVHESKNSLYVILEYLGGGSLSDYLKRSTEFLSDDSVIQIVKYWTVTQGYLTRSGLHRLFRLHPQRYQA